MKVGCIIGRKGEDVRKLCAETRARVAVLHGPVTSVHRIVSISFLRSRVLRSRVLVSFRFTC
ncbi:hypothetical protein DCAR_0416234 [Daucus carota subsp. sativus]|uniref:K Homology domain-containing protein n=1 Tax=Daucus carota subsp. sativus TaxID=79200 RepID=A0AAF0WXR0_DAUCS|nr:hypothetical protein DCAR_0416234 [Daucus carota subsp. sativus]